MGGNPSAPPYKKKVLVDAVVGRSEFNSRTLASGGYTATVFFAPAGQDGSNAIVSTLLPSPPTAGANPVLVVRNPGWVGKVVWSKLKSGANEIDGLFSGPFEGGVAYAAQVSWTPESAPQNVVQMPYGTYRAGTQVDSPSVSATASVNPSAPTKPVATNSAGASTLVSVKAGPTSQVSTYTDPAVSVIPNQSTLPGGQINLPDLGNEPEPVAPVKKPTQEAVGQNYRNGQAGTPHGTPNIPLGSGMLNPNGGQGSGNAGFPPSANSAPMPGMAPALNLGNAGAGASIGATATNFHFESKDYLAHVGLDYVSPKSSYGIGVKADGAALLSKTLALGSNLTFNNINEAVLNAVWMPKDTNIKTKLSAAYMWGKQNFDFYSGNAPASLTQASYYFSTQYVVPKKQSDYLHSVGVSIWGSRANQTNNPAAVNAVVETATAYNIMMDPRKLAVGSLQGESLDLQAGIAKQVIAKASMGYEALKFPFSDGSQELNKRIYQDYVVQYQPIPEIALQAGYKMGAAMNNIMLSAAYSQWKVTGFKNNGQNGVTGNQGVVLSYSIPLDGKANSPALGTLMRPELMGNSSYILRDAAIRPVQLPQAFLAKVDTTAVTQVASISKAALGPGATVNQAGNVLINVGTGNGTITGVTRNGAAFAYASSISATVAGVMIKVVALPAAVSGGDVYIVSMTDSQAVPYIINFTAAN